MKLKYRILLCLVSRMIERYRFWEGEARKMGDGGYVPPSSGPGASLFFKVMTRIVCFLLVGPVTVIGRENANFDGKLLIVGNHCFNMDPYVLRRALPYHFRAIGKRPGKLGLGAVVAAWVGVILVNVAGGRDQSNRGGATVQTAASYMAAQKRSRLVIFPQGTRVLDNVLREKDFRTGAARILTETAKLSASSEPIALLPVGIVFDCQPKETAIFDEHSGEEHIAPIRRFRAWRVVRKDANGKLTEQLVRYHGATIAIGTPVLQSDLPSDARECTRYMQSLIQAQMDIASG